VARDCALASLAVALTACTVAPPTPRPVSTGHLESAPPPAAQVDIPEPVKRRPFVPVPVPAPPEETFTVVVNEVPVRELLFALARDANVNVDVHPDIEGNVTLNAIDQSLNQILNRISRQLSVRYENTDGTLVIVPDRPFLRAYRVDYVNVTRDASGSIGAASSLEGEGQAEFTNTSSSAINTVTRNQFWEALESSIDEIVNPGVTTDAPTGQRRVVVNREGGLMLVRATALQHELVQSFLDQLMASVSRQVLIEATIVEVQLNDRYQAGIDWQVFTRAGGLLGAGITLGTDVGSAFTAAASGVTGLIFNAADAPTGSPKRDIEVSISLLNEFGDAQVLSSPKVMALNNQPAMLKVVDNEVYFEVDTELSPATQNTDAVVSLDTTVRTVSVGIVMNVTPQISQGDQVTLNVRPTVSRIRDFVSDPAIPVALAQSGNTVDLNISNEIPVIAVRETESVMRVGSGQLAILGGLMQDSIRKDDDSVPGFSEMPVFGEAFNFRERQQVKSELVVFLRPTVIRTPDVGADLSAFRRLLPENLPDFDRQKAPFVPLPGLQGGNTQ